MLAFTAAVVALSASPATLQNASPQIPIANAFIRNNGQWDPEARFLARSGGLDFWVTGTGFTLDFHHLVYGENSGSKRGHVVKVEVVGATGASANGVQEVPGVVNYLKGSPDQWVTNVPRYAESQSVNLVNGVDARYYFDNGAPRYDLIVRPGANPNNLKLNYSGVSNLRTENGVLKYDTSFGTVEERGLFVYQKINGLVKPVKAAQKINEDGTVSFQLGAYDTSRPLVIDPVVFSSFLGGSGNDAIRRNIVDGTGAHYFTGVTASADFPTVAGSYDLSIEGATDAFLTKVNADATALVYSTYFGGSGNEEGNGLAVFGSGSVVVVGRTSSGRIASAPLLPFPQFGTQLSAGGGVDDAFVTQFNATGTALSYSTLLGGLLHDQANNVVLNNTTVTVVGETTSTNFPARTNNPDVRPFQFTNGGGQDAFITNVNLDTKRVDFSTYVGGTGTETSTDVVTVSGLPVAVGTTTSTTLPGANYASKPGYAKTNGGGTDAWILGVGTNFASVNFWSFYGGSGNETAPAINRSAFGTFTGNLYIAGTSDSTNLPIVAGYQGSLLGFAAGYVARFSSDTSALLSSSFYRGSTGIVEINDMQSDTVGHPIILGRSRSGGLKLGGLDSDRTRRGGSDVFVTRFNPLLNNVAYGTYLGGNNDDWAGSLAMSGNTAVATGFTDSTILPNTAGKVQPSLTGAQDAFVAAVTMPVTFNFFAFQNPIQPYRWPYEVKTDGAVYTATTVNMTSDKAFFPVPATITIPAGTNRSGTQFVVPTPAGFIQVDETINLTATAIGTTLNQTVNIPAPTITSITFESTDVAAGVDVLAALNVDAPSNLFVPIGLKLVDASTGDPVNSADAFLLPGSTPSNVLYMPVNATNAPFRIRSVARTTDLAVKVLGPKGFASDVVTLRKTGIESFTINRTTQRGGTSDTITGTVRLTNRASVGGQVVLIDSDAALTTHPASITIPAGQQTGTFTFTSGATATDVAANMMIDVNGNTASQAYTILAPVLTSFILDFDPVVVGGSQRARVATDILAPAGGLVVTLTLESPATGVTVPATVTIPAGQRVSPNVLMPVDAGVGAPTTVTLKATLNGVSLVRTFQVNP